MYHKHLVFAAACLGMLLFGISLITLGSVAFDLQQKFQLDAVAAGTLFSILPVGILSGSLLFGPICDRYGYKWMLVLSCLGIFIGFEGIAYASSFTLLRWFIYLFGIGGGIINGATNAVVSDISTEAKGANLSLLGVFFGIGALGMPFVLGSLTHRFSFARIIAAVGLLTLAIGLFYAFIQFPSSKQAQGFPLSKSSSLFKNSLLLLIAFFLFCQSSFEAIINNWTTLYLTTQFSVSASLGLYGLSLFVLGLTLMRLLIGGVFRSVPSEKMLLLSLGIILAGIIFLRFGHTYLLAVTGLVLLGAGLAGGFPIMLGIVGNIYAAQSGTAFSFVLVVGLIGNILVNYFMGIIAYRYGIQHLTTVAFVEVMVMLCVSLAIFKRFKQKNKTYASNTMA